jgi:outer membrane lipoprotein SlyB
VSRPAYSTACANRVGALGVAVLGSLLSAHEIGGLRASFIASAALLLAVGIVALVGLRDAADGERGKA